MTLATNVELEKKTLESIQWLILQFQQEPFHFLYEFDLQALLLCEMRSRINTTLVVQPSDATKRPYRLNVVHSEYNGKIDITCIDPRAATEPSAKEWSEKRYKGLDMYIYSLPVLVGIELKYRTLGQKAPAFGACVRDFDKLRQRPVSQSFVLGFIQNRGDVDAFLKDRPREWVPSPNPEEVQAGAISIISPDRVSAFSRLA